MGSMKTEIRDFIKAYKDKLKNDEEIAKISSNTPMGILYDTTKRIDFYIEVISYTEASRVRGGSAITKRLFKLDAEDLEELYFKYAVKAKEEMEENIDSVKKLYDL